MPEAFFFESDESDKSDQSDALFFRGVLAVFLAFLDYFLLGVARHFFVMTEILGVNATASGQ